MILKFQGPATLDWNENPVFEIDDVSGEVYIQLNNGLTTTHWKQLGIECLIDAAYSNGFKLVADYKTMSQLSSKYGVRVGPFGASATVKLNLDSECDHDWFDYLGLNERFTFCKRCDKRKV